MLGNAPIEGSVFNYENTFIRPPLFFLFFIGVIIVADAKEPYQKRLVKVLRQFDRAGRTEVEKRHAVRAVAEDICFWESSIFSVAKLISSLISSFIWCLVIFSLKYYGSFFALETSRYTNITSVWKVSATSYGYCLLHTTA